MGKKDSSKYKSYIHDWVDLYNSGNSMDYIAKLYNCNKSAVRDNIIGMVSFRSGNTRYEKVYNDWVSMYNSGSTCMQISSKYKCSSTIVSNTLKDKGVAIRPLGSDKRRGYIEKRPEYHIFDTVDTEEKVYMLGLLLADGCIKEAGGSYHISLSLKSDDGYMVSRFANMFNASAYDRHYTTVNGKNHTSTSCQLTSRYLYEKLNSIGLIPNKSRHDDGSLFNSIPEHLMNHFIRGIFDGDGSIGIYYKRGRKHNTTHKYIAFSGTESVMNQVNSYLSLSCNIQIRTRPQSSIYVITTHSLSNILKITDFLYSDASIYLERKKIISDKIQELEVK